MNMRILTILILFIIQLYSCKIDPKDLTVIDGIKLGTTKQELLNQYDSLRIKEIVFYPKTWFTNLDEVRNGKFRMRASELFNSSQNKTQNIEHYGLFYPVTMSGTKNIVGLNILLVHTEPAIAVTKRGITSITKETGVPGISQDISFDQVENIANMLSNKYGKPSDTLKYAQFREFFVIENLQINSYHSDSVNIGQRLLWKTKYLDIEFFEGIYSSNSSYNLNTKNYSTYFDNKPFRTLNYDQGEISCKSYCYISYSLNNETVKKLELDKANL